MDFDKEKVFTTHGLALGRLFMDKFLNNLEIIELECSKFGKLSELKVYDYRFGKHCVIKVNAVMFQTRLQKIYRNFLEEEYFAQFSWYRNFCDLLQIYYLNNKKSFPSYSLLKTLVTDCFVEIATKANKYDYEKYLDILVSSMRINGHPDQENRKLFVDMMFFFESKKLLVIDSIESFSLQDQSFNTVLFLNSLYLPLFFDLGVKTLDRQKINIAEVTNFCAEIEIKLSLYDLRRAKEKFPWLFSEIENEMKLDIDFSIVNMRDIKAIFYYLHFLKVGINEYCFFSTILTLFDEFYNNKRFKNILFFYI